MGRLVTLFYWSLFDQNRYNAYTYCRINGISRQSSFKQSNIKDITKKVGYMEIVTISICFIGFIIFTFV